MGRRFYLYILTFPSGKLYFGLTSNKTMRFIQHRFFARNGSKSPVAAAIRKHGLPEYTIICVGSMDYITDLEERAIRAFKTYSNKFGYNRMIGPSHSEEARAKMSESKKGKPSHNKGKPSPLKGKKRPPRPPEWNAKISAALTGRKIPARTGIPLSAEHRAQISASTMGRKTWNKGIPRTPEERTAIKAGLDNSDKTAGARQKLVELNKSRIGVPTSEHQRAVTSLTHKGKPKSPEQRAKMSEARRLWWERRKSQ